MDIGLPDSMEPAPLAMTESNKKALTSNLVYLTENMEFDVAMNHLMERHVLTFNEKQKVYRNGATDFEKVERLTEMLLKKDNKAFYALIESLRATGQAHVAAKVVESDG
jgi:hypothetical protein